MKLQRITAHTYYLPGANNLGVIDVGDTRAIAIDTGMTKDTARTLRKALDEAGLKLSAIVNSHHHADHIGGNAYLLRMVPDIQIYAPPLEAVLIEHPSLQAMYLSMGATPMAALRNRWIMAERAPVHHIIGHLEDIQAGIRQSCEIESRTLDIVPLPGHSIAQVGIAYEGVCFVADGFFGSTVLEKYGIPYAQDIAAQLASIARLAEGDDAWFLPSHGMLTPRAELQEALAINRAAIEKSSELVLRVLPGDFNTITARVINALREQRIASLAAPETKQTPMGIPQYAILAGALTAHLSYLEQQGLASVSLEADTLVWYRT